MGCRNQEKAAAALEAVRKAAADAPPEVVPLDLADLDDVRACAERLTKELDHLDVLMNNAGVIAVPTGTRSRASRCSSGRTTWATSP
jgi:NAD(P)-dependent dehydrogenase (short-subunit alcohol dehydrogenase family)